MPTVILVAGNLESIFVDLYNFIFWFCVNAYKGMTAQTRKNNYSSCQNKINNIIVIACMLLTRFSYAQYKCFVNIHNTIAHKIIMVFMISRTYLAVACFAWNSELDNLFSQSLK